MIELKVESSNLQKIVLELKNFGRDISLISEPLIASAKYMKRQAIANFEAKGSLMQVGGWEKLRESTKARKMQKVGFVYPMLVRTNKLRSSFEIDGPRITENFGEIDVYNPVHYAIEHQAGWGILPERILLRLGKQQVQDIYNIFNKWTDEVIKKDFK